MSGGNPPVLALIVMTGGVVMLMAAVYDLNPLQAMKNVITGKNPKDAKAIINAGDWNGPTQIGPGPNDKPWSSNSSIPPGSGVIQV